MIDLVETLAEEIYPRITKLDEHLTASQIEARRKIWTMNRELIVDDLTLMLEGPTMQKLKAYLLETMDRTSTQTALPQEIVNWATGE